MKHIKRQLGPNEKMIYQARYYWWRNLRSFGLLNLFSEIAVTDIRVIRKTGILSVDVQSLPLDILENRDVRQSFWGRIFGFGDVTLHGTGGHAEVFAGLASPILFLQKIDTATAQRAAKRLKAVA